MCTCVIEICTNLLLLKICLSNACQEQKVQETKLYLFCSVPCVCVLHIQPNDVPPLFRGHSTSASLRSIFFASTLTAHHHSFKCLLPKVLAIHPLHHPPSARRPAAVRRPRQLSLPPSFPLLEASIVSPSRFGRNTFARNF